MRLRELGCATGGNPSALALAGLLVPEEIEQITQYLASSFNDRMRHLENPAKLRQLWELGYRAADRVVSALSTTG
jgi:hypothetical protein